MDFNKGGAPWNVTVPRGDDISITWDVWDEAGAQMDWTGATVTAATLGVHNWTVGSLVTGKLTVTLTGAQTQALGNNTFGQYLRVVKGGITSTWLAGALTVHPPTEPVQQIGQARNIYTVTTNVGVVILDGVVGTTGAGGGGGSPTGAAGGVLSGTYPNPGFAVDMATQAELNAVASAAAAASHTHIATDVSYAGSTNLSSTNVEAALDELDAEKAPNSHTHAAADVTSGVFALARLGSGTAAAGKYVDGGTGAWTALPSAVNAANLTTCKQTADVTRTTATDTDLTGMAFTLISGHYYTFKFSVLVSAATLATVGPGFRFTAPSMTQAGWRITVPRIDTSADADFEASDSDLTALLQALDLPNTAENFLCLIEGFCVPSANGTLQLRCRAETTGATLTFRQQSGGILIDHDATVSGGSSGPQEGMIYIPVSADEVTPLSTGTKWVKQWPIGLDITDIKLDLATPSTSGPVTVDIRDGNDVSLFSTKITIDVGETTNATAAVPYVLATSQIAEDGVYKVVVESAGVGTSGAALYVIGTRDDSNTPPVVTDSTLVWEDFDLGTSGAVADTTNTTADSVGGSGTLFISDAKSLEGGGSLHVIGSTANDLRYENATHTTHYCKFYYHHAATPGETGWLQYVYAADGTTLGTRFGVTATDTSNFTATSGKWYKVDQIGVGSGTSRWAIYNEANINNVAEVGASDVIIVTVTVASWSDERIGLLNTFSGGSSIPANLTDEPFNGTNGTQISTSNTSVDSFSGTAATTTFNTGWFVEGTSSLRVNGTAYRLPTFLNASHTFHGISLYFRLVTGAATGAQFYFYAIKTGDNAATAFQIGFDPANKVFLRNGNTGTGNNAITLNTAVTTSQAYRLDVSATAGGQLQCWLYTGANIDSTNTANASQTGTMVNSISATTFGREQLGHIQDTTVSVDCSFDRFKTSDSGIPSPIGGGTGTPIECFIEEYRSSSGAMPPNLNVVIDGGGGGGNTTVNAKLVPAVGCWFGTLGAPDNGLATTQPGIDIWETQVNRRADILHFYKTALNWTGPTAAEIAMMEPAGKPRAIGLYNWKYASGTTQLAIANGSNDANIATLGQRLSNYPYQIFLCLHHEFDNDGNRGGTGNTDANYIAAWRHVVTVLRANNRGNIVFVWCPTGYAGNAGNLAGEWWNVFFPGETYVDWLAFDPYKQTTNVTDLSELLNNNVGNTANGYQGFYWWAENYHPSMPIMLAEYGAWFNDAVYSDPGTSTPAQVAAFYATFDDQIENFPMLKAIVHYNVKNQHDNRIQMSGRSASGAALTTVGTMTYLNVGTNNAP